MPTPPTAPVVGFDLDMTLVDSRDGIAATLRAALAEAGVHVAEADTWPFAGLPLETIVAGLAPDLPPERVPAVAERYRALYPDLGVASVVPLPGAAQALAAPAAHGGRSVVVSAKHTPSVHRVLAATSLAAALDPRDVAGGLFGDAKGPFLAAAGATAYVGDHPGDVAAARRAGAVSVAVTTGAHDAGALRAAGADVVLPGLRELPGWLAGHVLDLRTAALRHRLAELGSVLVALSGGADSALLLAEAVRTLGPERVAAATAVSASLPAVELDGARALAGRLGVRLLTPRTAELARAGYTANGTDRCYHCKAELTETLLPLAAELGLAHVATGTNADDAVAGFRPGIRAAAERGAVTPLLDAGLTKDQVRAASARLGLPTADKPAAACLASRIAYGTPVTAAALARVEAAETALRAALAGAGVAVRDLRVRDLGAGRARVEVDAGAVARVASLPAAAQAVRAAGFGEVAVDPRGFRSGSMNEAPAPASAGPPAPVALPAPAPRPGAGAPARTPGGTAGHVGSAPRD
ncbi:ATP-dependent sacrificial sulfur transferase LarE [Kineococcus sp. NUM-3379]